MPDNDAPPRVPITDVEARLIAKHVLKELSDNFAEYVGRGVLHACGKGLLLLIFAVAMYSWASFGTVTLPISHQAKGH